MSGSEFLKLTPLRERLLFKTLKKAQIGSIGFDLQVEGLMLLQD